MNNNPLLKKKQSILVDRNDETETPLQPSIMLHTYSQKQQQHTLSSQRLSLPLPQLTIQQQHTHQDYQPQRQTMTQSIPSDGQQQIVSPFDAKAKKMFFRPEFSTSVKNTTLNQQQLSLITQQQLQQQQQQQHASGNSTKASLRSILQPIQAKQSSSQIENTYNISNNSNSNSSYSATQFTQPTQQSTLQRRIENNRSFVTPQSNQAYLQVPKSSSTYLKTTEESPPKNKPLHPTKIRSLKFHAEVKQLLDLISPPEKQQQQVKPSIFNSKSSNLLACFSTFVSQNILKQAEDKFKDYQTHSVLTIGKARELVDSHPTFFDNGSGLILIQSSKGCSIIPCIDKKINEATCYFHPIGTHFLIKEMREVIEYEIQGAELPEAEVNGICKEIIQKHCYFARHYSSEKADFLLSYVNWVLFKKPLDQIKDATKVFFDYTLSIQLGYSQIACTELIFTPSISNKHRCLPSIIDLIVASVSDFSLYDRQKILKNIACTGMYPQLPGFRERLTQEIASALPESHTNRVHVITH